MRRFGLTAKMSLLIALFGTVLALGLMNSVRGLNTVHEIDRRAFASLQTASSAALLSSRIAEASLAARIDIAASDREIEAALDRIDAAVGLVDASRVNLISSLPPELLHANAGLDPSIRTFIAFLTGLVDIGRRVSPRAALVEAQAEDIARNVREIITVTSSLRDGLDRRARLSADEAETLSEAVIREALLVALGLSLAGIVLAMLWVRARLTRPLRDLMLAIERATTSDRVIAVPHRQRRDEIGQLARTVQALSEVRATLVTRDVEAASAQRQELRRSAELQRIAEEFEARIGSLLHDIGHLSEQLHGVLRDSAVQAEQIAQGSGSAAQAMAGAGAEARKISDASVRLEDVVEQINGEVRRVSETAALATRDAAGTAGMVERLTENAAKIGDVVALIDAIARQTNLLALNATIEAARAGAHGRGFAVVAGEVKALAEQTAAATGQITQRIATVNQALSEAARAISGIVARVGAVEQASTEISGMVSSHAGLLHALGETISRISGVTGDAVDAMAMIAEANVQSVKRADQGAGGARLLDERIDALQDEAAEFARRLRAA